MQCYRVFLKVLISRQENSHRNKVQEGTKMSSPTAERLIRIIDTSFMYTLHISWHYNVLQKRYCTLSKDIQAYAGKQIHMKVQVPLKESALKRYVNIEIWLKYIGQLYLTVTLSQVKARHLKRTQEHEFPATSSTISVCNDQEHFCCAKRSQGLSEGREMWLVGKISMTQNILETFPNPLSLFNIFILLYQF